MLRLTELKLPLGHSQDALKLAILKKLGIPAESLLSFRVVRRGHDARRKSNVQHVYTVDIAVADEAGLLARTKDPHIRPAPDTEYKFVARAAGEDFPRPLVIGAGPCGLFAALILAQTGFRPIILERGKEVRARTKDTWALWRKSVLTPESNVQFGEGGAGTFSDGKLYSQIKDPRHLGRKVLTELVRCGAPEEILTEAHPHIGTFRLVGMVEHLRATIEQLGGEYRFENKVTDLLIADNAIQGVRLESGEDIPSRHVVLAVGHSARDVFEMLLKRGVAMEAKPFSIGFRIEHPQGLIDKAKFGESRKDLGAAEYRLVHHASNGRAVYSFCMCPGGTVVAAASEPGRVVTNGMSQYSRNERNANAGIVVGIAPEQDYPGSPLAGMELQRHWESQAFAAGGGTYAAPAQRVGDFIRGVASTALGSVVPSYRPGVTPTDLSSCLPNYAIAAIREALIAFGKQIKGFDMDDAVLTGVETRTSSPIRIGRGENFQSLNIGGLYPAGEGAGYAGGILSAAVDGIKIAEAVALDITATR
ncbi:MAG TPA: NAD(P)/FAD-dependent oxidoreductase [Rhizomicrobium sp.]|nr:NAD(P)/FAD-dependent oxidoreductase [Rhizomicrobium sp.]